MSALTIGLDDPAVFNRTSVLNLGNASGFAAAGANAYAGTHAPDIGNIRVGLAAAFSSAQCVRCVTKFS